jgi:thiosulfate dehydrogenase [quinone] large subunit
MRRIEQFVPTGRRPTLNGMTWVRMLVGVVWLNGAIEKFLNPEFPQQFATNLSAGGYVAQAPTWFQDIMRAYVVPNAELFAQFQRFGELALGLALVLGLLTNLAAVGSIVLSLAILLSQGGVRLGTGLGSPEFLNVDLLIALLSLVILLSPAAKALSLDASLARRYPRFSPILLNRRPRTRGSRSWI